ncbi:GLUG motif-containing protein [Vallitalea maricola]|uniref:Uncharacterized protein n=1 Tax=Vallitalea maricola TaxID=3074433 RepID=A0ACB5UPN7_9FIRM|nr:hypothetical protein AN2V17_41870 [Vallitalea sp. AN17-2]
MKKIVTIIMALVLTFSTTAYANGPNTSSDIEGHWAEKTMKKWVNLGLLKGYSGGQYKPDEIITNVEFIALINRIYGFYERIEENYQDVKDNKWYEKDTAIAKNSEYMKWHKKNILNPDNGITREEVSAVVAIIMDLQGTENLEKIAEFKDYKQIGEWSKAYLDALIDGQYLKGFPDKTIKPKGVITRAEAITILDNVVGTLIKKQGEYGKDKKQTIEGNVTLNTDNVKLKNTVINGDLIIAKGVKKGSIQLENVVVKGRILIDGGKEDSILINNSNAQQVVLKSPSQVKLGKKTAIEELHIKQSGEASTVTTEVSSKINTVKANAKVSIKGKGTINKADIQANGVTIEPKVNTKTIGKGINGNGVKVKETTPTDSSDTSYTPSTPVYIPSSAKEIIKTTKGVLVGDTLYDIPAGTKVSDLKAALMVSAKAKVEILVSSGGSAVEDQSNTDVADTMVIQVTAENHTKKEYNISFEISSECKITKLNNINYIEITENEIKGIPIGTTVGDLLSSMDMVGEHVTISKSGSSEVVMPTDSIVGGMIVRVTAYNGNTHDYTITIRHKSDENKIVSIDTLIGQLDGPTVQVGSGTTIGQLKDGIEASKFAKVYVLGINSDTVIKDPNKELENGMSVEVVSEAGTARVYSLSFFVCIDSIDDLRNIGSSNTQGKTYKLIRDLDFTDIASYEEKKPEDEDIKNWKPISAFQGTFDGNNKTIRNLKINDSKSFKGLFGSIYRGAYIHDLTLENVNINGDYSVGALVGAIKSNSEEAVLISNCHSSGSIKGDQNTGGLIGSFEPNKNWPEKLMKDCSSNANVSGGTGVGGLVGSFEGNGYDKIWMTNCHSEGSVSGHYQVGGLVGENSRASIENCYATGNIKGNNNSIGGLVGYHGYGNLTNCYSIGNVSGDDDTKNIGGIAGFVNSSKSFGFSYVTGCYSTGTITGGQRWIGGIAGTLEDSNISNCYSLGDIQSPKAEDIGGIAGEADDSQVLNCYSTSMINGKSDVGGIVGYLADETTIQYCVAMNPKLYHSYGRVVGLGYHNAKDNYANQDMQISPAPNSDKARHGIDITEFNKNSEPLKQWHFQPTPDDEFYWAMGAGMERPVLCTDPDGDKMYTVLGNDDGKMPLSSECSIESIDPVIGTINGDTVEDVLSTTTVSQLLDALRISEKATKKIVYDIVGDDVDGDSFVSDSLKIVITAEDTTTHVYAIKTFTPISSIEELRAIPAGSKKTYKLMNSLDFQSYGGSDVNITNWVPIDDFKGIFDGNSKTISHLSINREAGRQGLFSDMMAGAVIKNLTLEDPTIICNGASYIGALVGIIDDSVETNCSIINCHVKSTDNNTYEVSGKQYVGGLIGEASDRQDSKNLIEGCSNSAKVEGEQYIGGIVGRALLANILGCNNTGTINGTSRAGGISGQFTIGAIKNCHSHATVNGERDLGGIVGYFEGDIESCSTSGNIEGTNAPMSPGRIGGIAGTIVGPNRSITNSYSTATVTGKLEVGGIVGSGNSSKVASCYSTGTVTGHQYSIGGIIGTCNNMIISDCYSIGNITGSSNTGGIAGLIESSGVENSYSTGKVTSSGENSGGIAGLNKDSTVKNCYSTSSVTGSSRVGGIVGICLNGTATIQNCVAFNPELKTNDVNDLYICRVVGYKGTGDGAYTNYGYKGMLVNGTTVNESSKTPFAQPGGADITKFDKTQAPLDQWDFQEGAGKSFYWLMDSTVNRPILMVDTDGDNNFEKLGNDDGKISFIYEVTDTPVVTDGDEVTADTTGLAGTAETSAEVTVTIKHTGSDDVVEKVTAEGGNWNVTGLTLSEGDTIEVVAKATGEKESEKVIITVKAGMPTTDTPVVTEADKVTADTTSLAGTAEKDAEVTVTIKHTGSDDVVEKVTAAGGNWNVTGLTLLEGDTIEVVAKATGEKESEKVIITVKAGMPITDTPVVTEADKVTADTTSLTGTAEKDAEVTVTIKHTGSDDVVEKVTAAGGNWSVTGLTLSEGDTVEVVAKAAGEKESEKVSIIVKAGV